MSRALRTPLWHFLLGLPGLGSLVELWLLARRARGPAPLGPPPDFPLLRARDLPTVREGDRRDRVLARIDQDGFVRAVAGRDAALFPGQDPSPARKRNRLEVVLQDGRVLVRKRFGIAPPALVGWRGFVWSLLGGGFFTEAAALRRLRGVSFVPRLHRVDRWRRTLYLDALDGRNLHTLAAESGAPVLDSDPRVAGMDNARRIRHEARVLADRLDPSLRRKLRDQAEEMARRGVIPGDLHLANVLVEATGRAAWVDFEAARFAFLPRWGEHVAEHRRQVEEIFPEPDAAPLARTVAP